MIKRIWHGGASHANSEAYETLLRQETFPAIAAKSGAGFMGAELLRLDHDDEVEFMTILSFDALETIKRVTGEDATLAHVPNKAQALLSRWDERAQHFESRMEDTV